jgi:D-alanyl-lipoteichoic acid acyltransferase DltB (MBOAT superfamily)
MAIGIARMFNIKLPLNFNSPYKALNIIEFWRRWHMTLSRFLRDYLYIPLGGNRKGRARRHVNLLITMLLGGLWHGAGWTFVAWGLMHGIYLVINHSWHGVRRYLGVHVVAYGLVGRSVSWMVTFLALVASWVMFRAESFSGASNILLGMSGLNGFRLPDQVAAIFPGLDNIVETVGTMPLFGGGTIMGIFEMLGMFALMFVLIALPASHQMKPRLQLVALAGSFYFTIQAVLFSREPSEFLYFQF